MKSKSFINLFLSLAISLSSQGQNNVTVSIDISKDRKMISPYIYGRNNSLSDDPQNPLSGTDWQMLRDAGVTLFRESGGNNSTKYNWRRKLSSHPDWYNNVYEHDWDFAALSLQENLPVARGMWSFQLIGRVASTKQYNFNDYAYNHSIWWEGVRQNLAGGGTPNDAGGDIAMQEGDFNLYTMEWPADSTVGILDNWFGQSGLGLDPDRFSYWNMDNEVEIWSGTHDDVMPTQISAEEFMQLYFNVARKARDKFPGIKLVGPVTANEWQWYNWDNNTISYGGKNYSWLEYFIKRIGDEQKASGTRLLDVLDIHFYPVSSSADQLVQYHRVYFDKTYVFPEANGVKRVNGGWNETINKEYIFERCREWLEKYLGPDHGVTFGVTETGIKEVNPDVTAVWYASTLGEFMKNPVELFTPWSWQKGMWEVLHLYARYNKAIAVQSLSDQEQYVSAYSSVNANADSLTVVLVNRSQDASKNVTVNLSSFETLGGEFDQFQLSNLPDEETFHSHTDNALNKSKINADVHNLFLVLPPMSVTSLLLAGVPDIVSGVEYRKAESGSFGFFPNPVAGGKSITIESGVNDVLTFQLFDVRGNMLKSVTRTCKPFDLFLFDLSDISLPPGIYSIEMKGSRRIAIEKMVVISGN
jgi:hypothetical protein